MSIGTVYSLIMRFAIGRVHYTRYVKWGLYGALAGYAYSFYFTSQKALVF